MKFQFTNSTLGSKDIFLKSINEMLKDSEFKQDLENKISNNKVLKEEDSLFQMLSSEEIDKDGVELIKNSLFEPIMYDPVQFGKGQKELSSRDILQSLGDELRTINPKIFMAFLAIDILTELEEGKQRLNIKSFIGSAGAGKDTISEYYFYSITDTRTVAEVDFLSTLNSCINYQDQLNFLMSFLSEITTKQLDIKEGITKFEKVLYKNISKTVEALNKKTQGQANDYNVKKDQEELITFVSRPILNKEQYNGENYEDYEAEQKEAYKQNSIPFTKEYKEIFGYIRGGVDVHHYTEKLSQVIRLYKNKYTKDLSKVKEQLEDLLNFGSIKEVQKEEFREFFARLIKNDKFLEVIENRDLNKTIEDIQKSVFKNALEATKGKFVNSEILEDSFNESPESVFKTVKIYFDFDDVIVKFVPEWIKWMNEKLNRNYTMEDVSHYWFFEDVAKELLNEGKTQDEVYSLVWEFLDTEIYQEIEQHNNIIKIMKYLKNFGFDVKILSAEGSRSKFRFIKDHLPFMSKKDVVIAGDKSVVKPGVLVDDGGHNAEGAVIDDNTAYCLLVDANYNQHIKTGKRVTRVDVSETEEILNYIIAKACSSKARKHSVPVILEELGEVLDEAKKDALKGLRIEDLVEYYLKNEQNKTKEKRNSKDNK